MPSEGTHKPVKVRGRPPAECSWQRRGHCMGQAMSCCNPGDKPPEGNQLLSGREDTYQTVPTSSPRPGPGQMSPAKHQRPTEQAALAAQPQPNPQPQPAAPTGPRHVGVLRHAERVDVLEPADAAALFGEEFAWPDRDARPYDTPISDFDHPRRAAEQLKAYGFTRIVSSPFRRCLQTAAAVAAELGVEVVDVHKGVGEAMGHVKRNGWPGDSHELTYLTEEEMSATLEIAARAGTSSSGRAGAVVRLGKIMGEKPCFGQDDVKRMR